MKHRFEVLDIFRGIFATLVFLFHLSPFAKTAIINNAFVENADMFVDFFFVLSGFVIAYSYQRIESTDQAGLFLKKRFLRIYPLHLFMLLAFVAVEFAKKQMVHFVKVNNPDDPDNNIYSFISSLFLLNSTPLFDPKDVSWNIPSWSISAEMVAYILFAVVMLAIFIVNGSRYKNVFFASLVVLAGIALVSIQDQFKLDFTYDYGFLRGVLGFFLGAICMNAFQNSYAGLSQSSPVVFSILEILSVVLIITMISAGEILKPIGFVYEILFFGCIYIFAFEKGIVSSSFKKIGILSQLGKYSYSIYMCHALMISLFNVLFIRILKFPETAYAYLFILNFIVIYFFSAWTYKHIEMRFSYKKKKIAAPPENIRTASEVKTP